MEAASVLGLLVIGCMSNGFVWTNFAITFGTEDAAVSLQSTLDNIFPGLASLGVIWLFYWLLGKKVNTFVLIMISMAVCILLTALGVMAQ